MFNRILRAFRNDISVYSELKGNPEFASESWIVLVISIVISTVLATLTTIGNGISFGIFSGLISALVSILGYLVLVSLAWFMGTKLAKGTGSFTDIRAAVSYAYCIPTFLIYIPYIGLIASLWLLVTASSAIRETLGIGKGLTFFIVLISVAIFDIAFLAGSFAIGMMMITN
jgi:hypothetical protein